MTPQEEHDHLVLKIEQVKNDVEAFRQSGNVDKKLETMGFYQEYLEDELRILKAKLKAINIEGKI